MEDNKTDDWRSAARATLPDSAFDQAGDLLHDAEVLEKLEKEAKAAGKVAKLPDGWELLLSQIKDPAKHSITVFRRPRSDKGGVYEFLAHVIMPFDAKLYWDVSQDLDYHKVWDTACGSLHVIESLADDTELVYWSVKYPWPMSDREYVYLRRMAIKDTTDGKAYMSATLSQPHMPDKYVKAVKGVRVKDYAATMLITSKGPNVVEMTFKSIDNPEAPIPSSLWNYAVSKAFPLFFDQLADACANYEAWKAKNKK